MSSTSTAQKKQQKSIPPKRGQIILQIFENFKKVVSNSMVFKGGKGETSGASSASATPPASAYNSDGNHGI